MFSAVDGNAVAGGGGGGGGGGSNLVYFFILAACVPSNYLQVANCCNQHRRMVNVIRLSIFYTI